MPLPLDPDHLPAYNSTLTAPRLGGVQWRIDMPYRRTTKDVECRRCGHKTRIPVDHRISGYCCGAKLPKGRVCNGDLRMDQRGVAARFVGQLARAGSSN